MIFNYMVAPVV
ncbi:hypothetical protein CGLO_18290 [Colletotrichum gloeosporioides Cg-14]|uniref:Uncharacterized protein n=1 Tax=Colletotrichum gloeosporioides (strain Cg-14) TaxID=1237896 RepID=T0JRW4_COLGC|nr:hypothetical protein CGLO_18290 [Colletotrichum gloeosporioides Cg-14]